MAQSEALQVTQDVGFDASVARDFFTHDLSPALPTLQGETLIDAAIMDTYMSSDEIRESEINIPVEDLADHYAEVVVGPAAVAGLITMLEGYQGRESITPDEIAVLKIQIDNVAKRAAESGFRMEGIGGKRRANVKTSVDGFEGQKEGRKNKDEAVEHLDGEHAPEKEEEGIPTVNVSSFMDVVEGTKFLANRRKRAISVLAGIEGGKIQKPPSEDDWHYTDIFAAGTRMKDILTPEMTFDEKIDAMITAYGKQDSPWEVEMRILGGEKRKRNHDYIERAKAKGITVLELEDGDCAPMLEALLSDRPIFSAGSGGKEEVRIAAVAAYMARAFWNGENIRVDKDNNVIAREGRVFADSDIVTGDRDRAFIVAAGITGEDFLGLKPIELQASDDGAGDVWKVHLFKATSNSNRHDDLSVASI